MLHSYLFPTALPNVMKKIKDACHISDYQVKKFLKENKLHTLTPHTVYNWLQFLGFKYSDSRKSYYVDLHEKPENVQYRSKFIDCYETYELGSHQWIQVPIDRYNRIVEKGELSSNCGYRYEDGNGNTMVELHVDDHPMFQNKSNNLPYGGQLFFQVLYEQGWIDPHNYKKYTEKGQVGDMGMVLEETSINSLMKKQSDFLHELTLLQYYGQKLGVQVDRTPKCHPEMAGEGIEYLWALA
jgi:hypothetical protein